MTKHNSNMAGTQLEFEEMEGARRATAISSNPRTALARPEKAAAAVPDPEVPARSVRRRFTAKYKQRILNEAAACNEPGQLGALLRREGLYSSHLSTWQKQVDKGLTPKKRGRKAKKPDPAGQRIVELEKAVQQLGHKLLEAELIIAAQKKIAEIFQSINRLERLSCN